MAGVVRLWNDWEVQILVLVSFMLQLVLLIFARMRRRKISIVPRTLLWLAYLLADSIAIYILGHMSFYGKSYGHQQLMAFWAPFLLVHLGGQDNITAYFIEDSQLWPRHLLSFVVQSVGVAYVLYKYAAGNWTLVTAATLIFVSGVLKYRERIWALKSSSLENMSKFLDSRKLSEAKREQYAPLGQKEKLDPEEVLQGAHELLPICMAQFADYKFWPSRFQSEVVQLLNENDQMFELVEMQLSLMYDFLYTKAVVAFTCYGCSIRAISLVASITTSFLHYIGKNDLNRGDVTVTYLLIAGAVLLEMAGLLKAMGSTWTCALLHAKRWQWLHSIVVSVWRRFNAAERNRRWSGFIGYPELLNSSHGSGGCAQSLGCKDFWKKLHHSLPVISDGTKKLVLEEVRRMVEACEGKENIMRSYSGQCALLGFFKDPTSHAGIDFDEKIVSWYIATKMFFSWSSCLEERGYVEAIRAVSNYMLFLLAECPYMLPSPVLPGLYANTEAAYVGLDFSNKSSKGELNRRRRKWDLDTRTTDVDEVDRTRGKQDIIKEDLDITKEDLDRVGEDLDREREDLDRKRNGVVTWHDRWEKSTREELDKRGEELNRRREELNRRRKELDELHNLRFEVGGRREKLEVLDRRREELDDLKFEVGGQWEKLEVLDRRREELDRRRGQLEKRREDTLFKIRFGEEELEKLERIRGELVRRREELDRRMFRIIGEEDVKELNRRREDTMLKVCFGKEELEKLERGRNELFRIRWEKLNRRMEQLQQTMFMVIGEEDVKKLKDLDRRREELDRRRFEVDGTREENLDLDRDELDRRMKGLEELDRRSEELRFGPPPPLARTAVIVGCLLEAEARGGQEVWRKLLGVWVEILCYAAHHCSRESHARQLNSGGEFITIVWLLSTAMFNRSYCDEDWFKKGVQEFFRTPLPPFHPKGK
ncbi:hypothetical protein VPH35_041547 [Triticum aestivum]